MHHTCCRRVLKHVKYPGITVLVVEQSFPSQIVVLFGKIEPWFCCNSYPCIVTISSETVPHWDRTPYSFTLHRHFMISLMIWDSRCKNPWFPKSPTSSPLVGFLPIPNNMFQDINCCKLTNYFLTLLVDWARVHLLAMFGYWTLSYIAECQQSLLF